MSWSTSLTVKSLVSDIPIVPADETGERKGVNGHVANHATISTKKVNFDLASVDADKRAVQCSNPSSNPGEEKQAPEGKDRVVRSELTKCPPLRSLSSPPSSTLTPRTLTDVTRNNKEGLIPEDGSAR